MIDSINFLGLDKGKGCGDPTVHPETEPGPHASYEEGKRCAETLRFDYNRQRRIKIKVTRIVNIYGLSMHPNDSRVVSNVILQALRNEDMTLYGDGNQTRMSCYGSDLIDGFVRLVGTSDDFASPVNFGNPLEIPVGELPVMIRGMTNSRSRIVYQRLPQDNPVQPCPTIDFARRLLDWQPCVRRDSAERSKGKEKAPIRLAASWNRAVGRKV